MCKQKDDLNAFHLWVFGSAVTPTQVMSTEPRPDDEGAQEATFEEGDDLGYYPDGTKRTLTDDQIAMFRHSEIYSILRGRQVRQENKEADGDDQLDHLASSAAATPEGVMPHEFETNEDHERAHIHQLEEGYVASQAAFKTSVASFKRKRDHEDSGDRSGKVSTRRLVRELDFVTAEDQLLDYGDEPAEKISATHAHPGVASADDVAECHGKSPSVLGKKVWWPVIQATQGPALKDALLS